MQESKMTDNERLAKWQEWEEYHSDINKHVPDYLNDDDAAMSLLDTLAERGYKVQLVSSLMAEFVTWDCFITYAPRQTTSGSMDTQTRREAIIAACLEVARKELEG